MTSGKVDRRALPWPLPELIAERADSATFVGTQAWLVEQWQAVLGAAVPTATPTSSPSRRFAGRSQLVSLIRTRAPEFSVADVYDHPRLAAMASALGEIDSAERPRTASAPRARSAFHRITQMASMVVLFTFSGARWLSYLLTAGWLLHAVGLDLPAVPLVNGWVVLTLLLVLPPRSDGCRSLPGRRGCCSAGCNPATTRAAAGCICGCGWPSRSRTTSTR